jgi:hypothetical protein
LIRISNSYGKRSAALHVGAKDIFIRFGPSQQTEGLAGPLAPLKLDLTQGLIDGDFEVAHEGHAQ